MSFTQHSDDAFHGRLRFEAAGIARSKSTEHNDAVLHRHGDVGGIDIGRPFELFLDVAPDVFRRISLLRT
jgi:hypothetical protein